MNKELSLVLLAKINDIPFLDRTSGLVQVFEKIMPVDGDNPATIKKRIPVTSFASFQNCNTSQAQVAMIPNSHYKGMVYFEDRGISSPQRVSRGMEYTSSLRLVCWLNTKLISGSANMLLTAKTINEILSRMIANPFNSPPFTRVVVRVADMPAQDKNIFSNYDYSEAETQYLMSPFEYFAIDFDVNFTIKFPCIEPVTVTDNPNTCL